MKELPYFKFIPADFLGDDINFMSNEAIGIWTRFAANAWKNGGFLIDDELLQQKLNMCSNDSRQLFNKLTETGIIKKQGNKYFLKFQKNQIEEFLRLLEKKSKGGKASAQKRASKLLNSSSLTKATQFQQEVNTCSTEVQQKFNRSSTETQVIENKKEIEKEIDNNKENIKKGVSLLFHRRDSTKWTDKENTQLNAICKRPDVVQEFDEIKKLYESGFKYRRQDVITFLNNWAGELDKARNYKPEVLASKYDPPEFQPTITQKDLIKPPKRVIPASDMADPDEEAAKAKEAIG